MSDIDDVQLRSLDMTLLLVFEETMASGKLSSAARRLGLTQSAVSHAMGRLRDIFDDPLFQRVPHGVKPTPRALALRAPLAEALRLVSTALHPPRFDPAADARVFRIGASDHLASIVGPLLPSAAAPLARFAFVNRIRHDAVAGLQAGELDLALGYLFPRAPACDTRFLYQETYTVVGRREHPAFRSGLDLDGYTRCGHVLASPDGSLEGVVDRALAKLGRLRSVRLVVPYFLVALGAAARTDLLATVPTRMARDHAAWFELQTAPPPLEIRPFQVNIAWARRAERDPAVVWLRQHIETVIAAVPP